MLPASERCYRRSHRTADRRLHSQPPHRALHTPAGRAIPAHPLQCRRADLRAACRLPKLSPLRMFFTKGKGTIATVEGDNIVMRMRGRPMRRRCSASRSSSPESISATSSIRPCTFPSSPSPAWKSTSRPRKSAPVPDSPDEPATRQTTGEPDPRSSSTGWRSRTPRSSCCPGTRPRSLCASTFTICKLQSAGPGVAMKYDAMLTNPKPPGEIHSCRLLRSLELRRPRRYPPGWGLHLRPCRSGRLHRHRRHSAFQGPLRGRTRFHHRARRSLCAGFPPQALRQPASRCARSIEVLVDGTNGEHHSEACEATLGSTHFTTSGVVFKHEGDKPPLHPAERQHAARAHARRPASGHEGRALHGGHSQSENRARNSEPRWQGEGQTAPRRQASISPRATS